MAGRKFHPALFALFLAQRNPDVLATARGIASLMASAGFRISERMARRYRNFLVKQGYVVIVRDAEGLRVELTEKAKAFIEKVRKSVEKPSSGRS